MRIGIIGGGLSGISLQHFLRSDSEVLEREEMAGGLCRTFEKDGFRYDIGGHILFSKDKKINNFVKKTLGRNINHCRRNNKILFKDRFIKYPFENGLGALDKQDIYECLAGYLKNEYPKPANFKDWLYYTFGGGISEKYLIPYNRKLWKMPLERMVLDWVERVPKPPAEDVIKSALGIETEGYLHQLNFVYPRRGGIQSLIEALIKDGSRLRTGYTVKKIRRRNRAWIVSDGENEKFYDKLVLTIPLKEAVRCIDGVPAKISKAVDALTHNSVRVVLIGINNSSLLDKSAVYIQDKNIIPHRICYMGYFSKNMVPDGCSSLIAEVTTRKRHPLHDISDTDLMEKVIDSLSRAGIINRHDIIVRDVKNIEYAYVVHDLTRQSNIGIIKRFFASLGIELLGRFAEFEYINMDEVICRSMKAAAKLESDV